MSLVEVLDLVLHIDEWLLEVVAQLGGWAYVLFFLLVFFESGAVPMIFLPGDGFIFSLGVIASTAIIKIELLLGLLILAAILGYHFNYFTGRYVVKKWSGRAQSWKWIKAEHLAQTQRFFEKYGERAVAVGRFVPVVRTIMPLLAGIGHMDIKKFTRFNILGGIPWISLYVLGGYFLGNLPFVKHNFIFIYIGMILLTTLPVTIASFIKWRGNRAK